MCAAAQKGRLTRENIAGREKIRACTQEKRAIKRTCSCSSSDCEDKEMARLHNISQLNEQSIRIVAAAAAMTTRMGKWPVYTTFVYVTLMCMYREAERLKGYLRGCSS